MGSLTTSFFFRQKRRKFVAIQKLKLHENGLFHSLKKSLGSFTQTISRVLLIFIQQKLFYFSLRLVQIKTFLIELQTKTIIEFIPARVSFIPPS